jgi:hypothetical protein
MHPTDISTALRYSYISLDSSTRSSLFGNCIEHYSPLNISLPSTPISAFAMNQTSLDYPEMVGLSCAYVVSLGHADLE